jgi:hypothetical protein
METRWPTEITGNSNCHHNMRAVCTYVGHVYTDKTELGPMTISLGTKSWEWAVTGFGTEHTYRHTEAEMTRPSVLPRPGSARPARLPDGHSYGVHTISSVA